MKLEHLCDVNMQFVGESVVVQPSGSKEGEAYVAAEGTVSGDRLRGAIHATDYLRLREDGVYVLDAQGYIATEDGAKVLVRFGGLSTPSDLPGVRRALLSPFTFQASDPRYQWLNAAFAVAEGKIGAGTPGILLRVYLCINDLVREGMPFH
ncbi:MAG: DUF3237 family protein [Euryarchaeota archaeon]|nr:DUF3237 family protein [Euryarchaeota archaeon]